MDLGYYYVQRVAGAPGEGWSDGGLDTACCNSAKAKGHNALYNAPWLTGVSLRVEKVAK